VEPSQTAAPAFDFTDATVYNCDGLSIAIPNAYIDRLIINAEPKAVSNYGTVLLSVSEKQSIEDAIKDYGSADGHGALFGIARFTPEQYTEVISADYSGLHFFARDGGGNYYGYSTATDVQLYRAGGELGEAAFAEWQQLIAMGDSVKADIIARNGLTPYSD